MSPDTPPRMVSTLDTGRGVAEVAEGQGCRCQPPRSTVPVRAVPKVTESALTEATRVSTLETVTVLSKAPEGQLVETAAEIDGGAGRLGRQGHLIDADAAGDGFDVGRRQGWSRRR